MVATAVSELAHVTALVRFWVEPSLYVPVAVYCTWPAGAVNGAPVVVMEIEVRVADVTVSAEEPVTPNIVALMFAVPAATPVTTPLLPEPLLTVATPVLSEAQVT
jgi:hypothetical protein